MPNDPEAVLALLKDPNVETQQIAAATGTPREEAARAARLVHGIARAKPEEVATLPPLLALAVLRAAGAAGRVDILAAAALHGNKDVAKDAKRALYLLKSRGVAVPEAAKPAPTPPPAAAPEPPPPCYVSSIDSHGERAVWIARHVPGRGVEVAQAVISDVNGLVELQIGMLGRKEYRAFARDLAERGRNMGVLEIDREAAKSLVVEARARNDASDRRPPDGADAWLARIGPAAAPAADPAARFPPLPDDEERAAVEASGDLHLLPLLRGWIADEDALRAVAQKLDEIAVSPLYVDDRQRAEQGARVVADAVSAAFEGERRARWASRLFAVAAHLADGGDAGHATQAAAAARAIARGDDPARIPFARLLVEKAFPAVAPPAAAPAARAEATSPLIVTPR